MAKIPGLNPVKWYDKEWPVEGFASVPPIIVAAVGGLSFYFDSTKPKVISFALFGAVAWLALATVLKVRRAEAKDQERKRLTSPDGLLGCVMALYQVLRSHKGTAEGDDPAKLRLTIHRVVPAKTTSSGLEILELEQVLPYVGAEGGEAGRRFSKRSGIIGFVLRDKHPYAAERQNDGHEAFVDELIKSWSYTQAEAKALTADRQAWMAVPVFDRDKNEEVGGIVFLDSCDKNYFDDNTILLITHACAGITDYIDKRY